MSSFALFSDSSKMSKDAKDQLKSFTSSLDSINGNTSGSSATLANEAYQYCGGQINGPLSNNLKKLMKVGLHNYCDQYKNPEEFCLCVGEVTHEKKLTKEDLNEFKSKLEKENMQNLAYTSMKSLVDFKSLKVLSEISSGKRNNDNKFSCTSPVKFNESISDECGENELNILRESYKEYNSNCSEDKCLPNHKLSSVPREARTNHLSENQRMFALAGKIASDESTRLIKSNYFNTEQIVRVDGTDQFGTINGVQEYHLAGVIAYRLTEKYKFKADYQNQYDIFNKYNDIGLIESLSNFNLFKDDPRYFNSEAMFYTNKEQARSAIDKYLDYFAKKMKEKSKKTNLASMSSEELTSLLVEVFNEQTDKNVDSSCEKAKETFRKSCRAIKDKEIAFNFEKNSDKFRDRNYKGDKFKFDQLYCVSQDLNTDKISNKVLNEEGFYFFSDRPEISYKVNQSKEPVDYLVAGRGDIDDYLWSTGLENGTIAGMLNGTRVYKLSYKADSLTGYPFDPTDPAHNNDNLGPRLDNTAGMVPDFSGGYGSSFDWNLANGFQADSEGLGRFVVPRRRTLIDIPVLPVAPASEIKIDRNQDLPDLLINSAVSNSKVNTNEPVGPGSEEAVNTEPITADAPRAIIVDEDPAPTSEVFDSLETENNSVTYDGRDQEGFSEHSTSKPSEENEFDRNDFSQNNNSFMNDLEFKKDERSDQSNNIKYSNIAYENLKANTKKKEVSVADSKNGTEDIVDVSDDISKAKESLELQKLKLELEKTKLELANTENLIKQESVKATTPTSSKSTQAVAIPAVQKYKESVTKSTSNSPRVNSASSAPARSVSSSSNSNFAPSTRRTQAVEPQVRTQTTSLNQAPSTRTSSKSINSNDYVNSASTVKRGALLSASSVTNEQILKDTNGSSNTRTVRSAEDLSSIGQETLKKYYEEGAEFVVQDGELAQTVESETLQLEKDEESGEIKVVKKAMVAKRAPASKPIIEEIEAPRERKVFSYDEFKTILDSSREE
jgi:hypothetical protein